jgi:hypothetical protein
MDFSTESQRCGCEIFCALTAALKIYTVTQLLQCEPQSIAFADRMARLISMAPSDHNEYVISGHKCQFKDRRENCNADCGPHLEHGRSGTVCEFIHPMPKFSCIKPPYLTWLQAATGILRRRTGQAACACKAHASSSQPRLFPRPRAK